MSGKRFTAHQQAVHFETRCKELGIPLTIQRRVIYETLATRKDHPTVDDIFKVVRQRARGISRATVYRVLEAFVKAGLVRHFNSAESAVRFDPNLKHHHHLVCSRCSSVIDFEDAKLDQLPMPSAKETGFSVETFSVYFEGLCQRCQKVEGESKEKRSRRKV